MALSMAQPPATSGSSFVSAVCQTFGILVSDCTKSLTYNIQASTSAGFAGLSPATPNSAATVSARDRWKARTVPTICANSGDGSGLVDLAVG